MTMTRMMIDKPSLEDYFFFHFGELGQGLGQGVRVLGTGQSRRGRREASRRDGKVVTALDQDLRDAVQLSQLGLHAVYLMNLGKY